jgi:hypothetical protein
MVLEPIRTLFERRRARRAVGADREPDVAVDPQVAGSRATGGGAGDGADSATTTGTGRSETFVGRVAGEDLGYIGDTGAERRASAGREVSATGRSGRAMAGDRESGRAGSTVGRTQVERGRVSGSELMSEDADVDVYAAGADHGPEASAGTGADDWTASELRRLAELMRGAAADAAPDRRAKLEVSATVLDGLATAFESGVQG